MLSQKNEKYLKNIVSKLLEKFQSMPDINQDRINYVIDILSTRGVNSDPT